MRESSKRRRHSRNQPTCLARAKLKTTLRALHMSWSMLELAKLEFHAGSGVNQYFKLLKRNLSRLKAQSAIRIDPHIVTKNFYPALDSLLNRFYRFYLWTVSIYHTERDAFFVASNAARVSLSNKTGYLAASTPMYSTFFSFKSWSYSL